MARVSTALAEVAIQGIAISGYPDGEGPLVSYAIITNTADPEGAFFQDSRLIPVLGPRLDFLDGTDFAAVEATGMGAMAQPGDKQGERRWVEDNGEQIIVPGQPAPVDPDACARCWDQANNREQEALQTRNDAYDAAQNAVDQEVSIARDIRAQAVASASATAAVRMQLALSSFVTGMLGCTLTSFFNPIAGLICGSVASIAYASALAIITSTFNSACAAAEAAYDAAWQAAVDRYDQARADAEQAYEDALDIIGAELDWCLAAYGCPSAG